MSDGSLYPSTNSKKEEGRKEEENHHRGKCILLFSICFFRAAYCLKKTVGGIYSASHWRGSWVSMASCVTSHMIQCSRGLGRFMFHILLLNKQWAPWNNICRQSPLTLPSALPYQAGPPRRSIRGCDLHVQSRDTTVERRLEHHTGQRLGCFHAATQETY